MGQFGTRRAISVSWTKCQAGNWCSLENVNLSEVDTKGVYIIWYDGNPGRVVRVGQGDIKDRLCCHRDDGEIVAYRQRGTLMVTWAAVAAEQRDGVERYLADTWDPLVGDCFPDAVPIVVNSPWS